MIEMSNDSLIYLIDDRPYTEALSGMQLLSARFDLDSFFSRLLHSQERLLLLDYDGTLAPFQTDRNQAFPYPGVIEALSSIQQDTSTRIVIVSGRATKDLLSLLKLSPIPEIWGSHGWEHIDINGEYTLAMPDEASAEGLSQARKFIESNDLERFCEHKPVSLAIHWRGLAPEVSHDIQTKVEKKWKALEQQTNLSVNYFDGGIELCVLGKDKGTAVEAIANKLSKDAVVAYLGDDLTDEDAFVTLQGKGLNVLVRKELRSTAADLWLQPPEELLDFLARWQQSCSNKS